MERFRFHKEGSLYFVTFTIVEWLPVFVSEAACRIVSDSLNFCHKNKGLRTNAYVIMPTHIHAILFHADFGGDCLRQTVADFRKFTGRRLLDYCAGHMPRCFSDSFRHASGADRARRFWQQSRHPVVIESERFWKQKLDYLHENPCRKGLVARPGDWRFSSAGFWVSEGQQTSEVTLSAIVW